MYSLKLIAPLLALLIAGTQSQFIADGFSHSDLDDETKSDFDIFNNNMGIDVSNLQPVDGAFLDKFEKVAIKSINEESVKFGEAVVTVMTQRIEQYLLMNEGEVK